MELLTPDPAWASLHREVVELAQGEPVLAPYLRAAVIDQSSLEDALIFVLTGKLASPGLCAHGLSEVFARPASTPALGRSIRRDLEATVSRDPAAGGLANPFLNHKGFHALQTHRVAAWYWRQNRRTLARFLQSRVSEVFAVDIHPAASLGDGLFIDHGTGVVIGETAVVGDDVSILQGVTLGGTGKQRGDRHPKIGAGVLISAGAKVLGNIRVGAGVRIGAGSVVLADVPAHRTVVGVPARVVGPPRDGGQPAAALAMDQAV